MQCVIERDSEPAASGNGAIPSLFHVGGQGRAVPEPIRWALLALPSENSVC